MNGIVKNQPAGYRVLFTTTAAEWAAWLANAHHEGRLQAS
jgi:hypothetical protein